VPWITVAIARHSRAALDLALYVGHPPHGYRVVRLVHRDGN